jgi:hypothetical protein
MKLKKDYAAIALLSFQVIRDVFKWKKKDYAAGVCDEVCDLCDLCDLRVCCSRERRPRHRLLAP